MDDKPAKPTLADKHAAHRDEMWPRMNWRAWGSWFSWGSPVGLGLFFISLGVTLWIFELAIHVK